MELEGFRGAVIEPGHDDYETARQIWNGHRPAARGHRPLPQDRRRAGRGALRPGAGAATGDLGWRACWGRYTYCECSLILRADGAIL